MPNGPELWQQIQCIMEQSFIGEGAIAVGEVDAQRKTRRIQEFIRHH
jgi:hypothetical protein